MYNFRNDYSSGAHPKILDALRNTNAIRTPGYGCDNYCREAADLIRSECLCQGADVHFFIGGTQVNKTAINAFLRPYEAVIAASTAHICVHETGAVEQDGHKIIYIETQDGKLRPDLINSVISSHSSEHMVTPRLVYISNTTEVGTVYSASELKNISDICRKNGLLIYCDGARLGSAMTIKDADTSLSTYAEYCDAFTIGGTKNGLLFGEALVITNDSLKPYFRSCMKQQGAILAKGRLLGIQYKAVLENGLYFELSKHANEMAELIRNCLESANIPVLYDSPSNQIFPVIPDSWMPVLERSCTFEVQCKTDSDHTCIRFVTGWDTDINEVLGLNEILKELSKDV